MDAPVADPVQSDQPWLQGLFSKAMILAMVASSVERMNEWVAQVERISHCVKVCLGYNVVKQLFELRGLNGHPRRNTRCNDCRFSTR
ncbi:hypothetical protein FHS30_001823 [Simiduia aestuariiviva]|uniref:Uncharacterized protein n=1 Tax=Simiduia aestuariiviva TaxID=1510459 RepID=A0A839UQ86_9GAMM|nr:hypothetical protein [Simiduia aestuariiviva]